MTVPAYKGLHSDVSIQARTEGGPAARIELQHSYVFLPPFHGFTKDAAIHESHSRALCEHRGPVDKAHRARCISFNASKIRLYGVDEKRTASIASSQYHSVRLYYVQVIIYPLFESAHLM